MNLDPEARSDGGCWVFQIPQMQPLALGPPDHFGSEPERYSAHVSSFRAFPLCPPLAERAMQEERAVRKWQRGFVWPLRTQPTEHWRLLSGSRCWPTWQEGRSCPETRAIPASPSSQYPHTLRGRSQEPVSHGFPASAFTGAFTPHFQQLCSYFGVRVCWCPSWSPCPQSMGMCFLPPPLGPASWPSPSRDY